MPPRKTKSKSIKEAVIEGIVARIGDPEYNPPSLDYLEASLWPTFAPTETEGGSTAGHAMYRQLLHEMGAAALDRVFFLLLLEYLPGKPKGFTKTLTNAILSQEILRLIMKEINPRFLQDVDRIDAGFNIFFGACWEQAHRSIDTLIKHFGAIFKPLIEAGVAAYMRFEESRKKSQVVKPPVREIKKRGDADQKEAVGTPAPVVKERCPADLQFLLNVRRVQLLNRSPTQGRNPADSESSDSSSSMEGSSVSINGGQVDLSWSAYQEPLVPVSPLSFSTVYEAAPCAEAISEDFHIAMMEAPFAPPECSPAPPRRLEEGHLSDVFFAPQAEISLEDLQTSHFQLLSPGAFRLPTYLAGAEDELFAASSSGFSTVPLARTILDYSLKNADRSEAPSAGGLLAPAAIIHSDATMGKKKSRRKCELSYDGSMEIENVWPESRQIEGSPVRPPLTPSGRENATAANTGSLLRVND